MQDVRKGMPFLVFLSLGIFFMGCNITYKVRNQDSEIEQVLHFPCGKVAIELVGKGNSKFMLRQRFDVNEKISVFKDSLFVYYNNKIVPVDINQKAEKFNDLGLEIGENSTLEASFDLDKGVFEGDTIIVYGKNYIKCFEESITLDTVIFSFVNNLRIKGVNDFR